MVGAPPQKMQYSVSETIAEGPMARETGDQYSEKDTKKRMDDALRRAMNTPPKPHAAMKSKPKVSRASSKPSSPKTRGGKA